MPYIDFTVHTQKNDNYNNDDNANANANANDNDHDDYDGINENDNVIAHRFLNNQPPIAENFK